jgi:hypothetical protein
MSATRIRAGRISDAADLLLMIEELAEFEKEKGQVDSRRSARVACSLCCKLAHDSSTATVLSSTAP